MSKDKIIALIGLITLALGVTAIDNAVTDEARNEAIIEGNLDEILHKGDLDAIDEIVAVNYVRHMPGGHKFRGREGYRQHHQGFMTPLSLDMV